MKQQPIVEKITSGITYNIIRIFASLIIMPIYSIIVVRWLTIEKFGGYAFLEGIFSILAIIWGLGIISSLSRFIPELAAQKDYARLRRLLGLGQKIGFTSTFIAFILIYLSADQLASLLGYPDLALYIRLIALGSIPGFIYGIIRHTLDALYEQKFINLFGIVLVLIDFVVMIILVTLFNLGITGIILVGIIDSLLGACICYSRLRRKHYDLISGDNRPLGKELKSRVVKYSTSSVLLDSVDQFISKPSEKIFLGLFATLSDVTYYDVSYTFAQRVLGVIYDVIGSIGLISMVEIKTTNPLKLRFAIRQYMKIISLYVIPITVGGLILAEPIMIIFYGDQMSPAVGPFQLLLILFCLHNLLYINRIILRTYEKMFYLLLGNVVDASISVILGLYLIPKFGILGAIFTAFIGPIITGVVYNYESMIRLGLGNIWPIRDISKYVLVASLMALFLLGLRIYEIENPISLLLIVMAGCLFYMIGLRLTRAITEDDKELVRKSSIPLKNVILKLF